jgi:hypothetical protein
LTTRSCGDGKLAGHLVISGLALLVVLPARAVSEIYTIDPVQSIVTVESSTQLRIDLFGLVPTIDLPILSQEGAGGTGGTLPDGSSSDGLRAALTGQLLVDVQGDLSNPTSLQILSRRTSIRLEDSGTWLPGLPGAPSQAAPGGLALRFEEPSFGLTGMAALRGFELTASHSSVQSLGPLGDGLFSFSLGLFSLNPVPVDGVLDFQTSLPGSSQAGRAALFPTSSASVSFDATEGQLLQQPAGGREITVPLTGSVFLAAQDFIAGIPWGLTLDLSGQLVATNAAFVPEPSPDWAFAAALLPLVWLERRGRLRR